MLHFSLFLQSVLYFSYVGLASSFTKLGLPDDDVELMKEHSIWFPAVPLLLYLASFAFMTFYVHLAHTFLATQGRILSAISKW